MVLQNISTNVQGNKMKAVNAQARKIAAFNAHHRSQTDTRAAININARYEQEQKKYARAEERINALKENLENRQIVAAEQDMDFNTDDNKENLFNGPSDNSLLKLSTRRVHLENEVVLKHERKVKASVRRRNLLVQLENEKEEVNRSRRKNIRKMKVLSSRKIEDDKNRQPVIFLTECMKTSASLDKHNVGSMQKMNNGFVVLNKDLSKIAGNTSKVTEISDEVFDEVSDEVSVQERTDSQAQATEVIRGVREVKQAELMRIVKEREEARKMRATEETYLDCEMSIGMSTLSTVSIDSFDWEDDSVYASPFTHQPDCIIQKISANNQAIKDTTEDLAETIRACDVKLSDIQILKSMILAEEAAFQGKDEFKTAEHLTELESVKMLFSVDTPWDTWKPQLGFVSRRARHGVRLIRRAASLLVGRPGRRRSTQV